MKRVKFSDLIPYQQGLLAHCDTIARGSKCLSRKVGAVWAFTTAIREAVNRPPLKMPSCTELGACPNNAYGQCTNCLHAEEIIMSEITASPMGGTMYITSPPCYRCANMMIERGIGGVVCYELARDNGEGVQRLVQAGVAVLVVERGWR